MLSNLTLMRLFATYVPNREIHFPKEGTQDAPLLDAGTLRRRAPVT